MIRSMTAFGRAESQGEWGTLVWELRSVNHRFLEVGLRLPEEFRAHENAIRERIQGRLGRGKVDGALRFQPAVAGAQELVVDEGLAKAVIQAAERVEKRMNNPARLSAMDILRWPGVTQELKPDVGALRDAAFTLLDRALDELCAMRAREGERLQAFVAQRLEGVAAQVESVRARRAEVLAGVREKLLARIRSLDVEADPQRLEQELAIVAQRLDVEEELDRLGAHITEVTEALGKEEAVGRRLDFLMQEFNREANTLGSKANDAQTTQAAVELKVLIEQMREQIQNIE